MKYKTLVAAGMRKMKGSLMGIALLTFFVSLAMGTVITIWNNSSTYINDEITRAGYGTLTAWVSGVPDEKLLMNEISQVDQVERVTSQEIIYSNYHVGEAESDSEGQLILFTPQENPYKKFSDDLSGYEQMEALQQGEIYISPSMISMFDLKVGDTITFSIARSGGSVDFQVKGYYEDPFMGSSMIGMKGFLICHDDFEQIKETIANSGIDGLARPGAMIHIFGKDKSMDGAELSTYLYQQTQLANYVEFVHTAYAISGFMMVLQNAFAGLLFAFVVVLVFVTIICLGHSISSGIEADYVNMGILKTLGYNTKDLRLVQIWLYLIPVLTGMAAGAMFIVPASSVVGNMTITTTGVRIPVAIPVGICLLAYLILIVLLVGYIVLRTSAIGRIKPLQAIVGKEGEKTVGASLVSVHGKWVDLRLAFRQLISSKRNYLGVCLVAILLVFFASLVGRMNAWLGPDGKGMMDAFNPADHDIGVQVFGNLSDEQAREQILSYTGITDSYLLAMPSVAVNGVDYTANVIDQPQRFHILEGNTCMTDTEIVITEYVADYFHVGIGDAMTVQGDNGSDVYTISGIYQCANDMGGNIGMSREGYLKIGRDAPNIWCHHYFLENPSLKSEITASLEEQYGGDVHVHENSWPGLAGIIAAMHGLLVFMYGMVIVFTLIVTFMTGNRILSQEQKSLGIYKAIGYKTNRLRKTFALRFLLTAAIGAVIGAGIAACFADSLVAMVMTYVGIADYHAVTDFGTVAVPIVIVVVLFTGFAYLAAGKIKQVDLTVLVSE